MLVAILLIAQTISGIDVRVEGIGHTHRESILRLMSARPGADYDPDELQSDLARLRTLGILYDVDATASADGDQKRIDLRVKDRWSLVPVLGVRRGGGRTSARVGVSDHNAFGRLFSLYGELTSNAEIPFVAKSSADRFGSYVYTQVPRLFGSRFTPKLSWLRDFSDFTSYRADGSRGFIYDRARHQYRFELRYEIVPRVTFLGGADFRQDAYSTSSLTPDFGTLPSPADAFSGIVGAQLGQVEEDVSQLRGVELSGFAELGKEQSGTAQLRAYAVPFPNHNLCFQLVAQMTTGRGDSYLFRAGGQREIRGFLDAYFEGQRVLRGNLEWRYDFWRTDWLVRAVHQLAVFADGGYIGRRVEAVAGLPYEGPVASVGVGVRAIPVPFAKAVGRLDFATGLWPRRTFDISFSGQQFF